MAPDDRSRDDHSWDPDEDRVVHLTAGSADAGVRIDRVLAWKIKDLSRVALQRLIKGDQVTVSGRGAIQPKTPLREGDEIEVRIPPDPPETIEGEAIPIDILYEDRDIAVVVKPAGICSHPAPAHPRGTLVHALVHHFDSLSEVQGAERPGIVHRLDKDTSGVMVCAKRDEAHRHLQDQFRLRTVKKAYRAITRGRPRRDEGTIDEPIGRSNRDFRRMAIRPDAGKQARTRYEVLADYGGRFAHVECKPRSGRTHQIRVHLLHLGCPIICDEMYGHERRITGTELLDGSHQGPLVMARQALHARAIAFRHPQDERWMTFEAEPPGDFRRVLEILDSGELPTDLKIAAREERP